MTIRERAHGVARGFSSLMSFRDMSNLADEIENAIGAAVAEERAACAGVAAGHLECSINPDCLQLAIDAIRARGAK